MSQQTIAGANLERFLMEIEQLISLKELAAVITSCYPKVEGDRRSLVGVERMLRIRLLAILAQSSDSGVEATLYDSRAMRQFVGIDLRRKPVLNETTICKFWHLLEPTSWASSSLA